MALRTLRERPADISGGARPGEWRVRTAAGRMPICRAAVLGADSWRLPPRRLFAAIEQRCRADRSSAAMAMGTAVIVRIRAALRAMSGWRPDLKLRRPFLGVSFSAGQCWEASGKCLKA